MVRRRGFPWLRSHCILQCSQIHHHRWAGSPLPSLGEYLWGQVMVYSVSYVYFVCNWKRGAQSTKHSDSSQLELNSALLSRVHSIRVWETSTLLIVAVGTHCPQLQNKMFEADENLSYLDLILMHCIKLQICTINIIINKPSKWMIVAQILSLYGCNEWPEHPSFWNGWRSAPDSWPLVLFSNRVQNMDHGPYSRALCTWHLYTSSLLLPLLGSPNPHTLCKALFCITTP